MSNRAPFGRRGRLASVALAVALGAGALTVSAAPAQAASSVQLAGTVTCSNGQEVEGVWVSSSAGGARWADWFAFPGRIDAAYYSTNINFAAARTIIELHIGCGGTRTKWTSTNLTPRVTIQGSSFTVNAQCDNATPGRFQSCTFPQNGNHSPDNRGIYGWCTWGAYEKWKAATGYYPAIGGNANEMDQGARANGWRVVDVPSRRSMAVRESGGADYGHVMWVDNIRLEGGKVKMAITEMNGGAQDPNQEPGHTYLFGRFTTREVDWDPNDYSFIQTWH